MGKLTCKALDIAVTNPHTQAALKILSADSEDGTVKAVNRAVLPILIEPWLP